MPYLVSTSATTPSFIHFDIADMSAKSDSPLIGALDWLLRLPTQRCRMSELVDLLEVGAIASRFGIDQESLPKLTEWMVGAGIRWGLNDQHRTNLNLGACGDQNSAWFGLQRMLLGYASGAVPVDVRLGSLEAIRALCGGGRTRSRTRRILGSPAAGFIEVVECGEHPGYAGDLGRPLQRLACRYGPMRVRSRQAGIARP